MREVLLTYLQFLYYSVHENVLWFMLVALGVPCAWLIAKLTNFLHEEIALKLGTFVFFLTSVIALVLLCLQPSPQEYYKPLLYLLAGVLTFLCVAPIYGNNPSFDIHRKRKQIILDGVTYYYEKLVSVHLKRCFTRTKRSCLMEIDFSDDTGRVRTLYYETNDVNRVRAVVKKLKSFADVDYDAALTRLTIEVQLFSSILKALLVSLFVFGLILPASSEIKEKAQAKSLPEYKLVNIPASLYVSPKEWLLQDSFEEVFRDKDIQIILFDGPYSSHFVGNYRKALYSVLNQNYDFNIVFVNSRGLTLKRAFGAKSALSNRPEDIWTKFIVTNCKKLCFIDNSLHVMYSTDVETVDPRATNVQDAINMYVYVSDKNSEEKSRYAARQREIQLREQAEQEATEEEI